MTIISFEHRFIFVKTIKVAGTSVGAALRPFTGPRDIVRCVTPRDEFFSIEAGYPAKNYAEKPEDERAYTALVADRRFDEARAMLQGMKKNWNSHVPAERIRKRLRKIGEKYEDFTSFTIERHPYTWMISRAAYSNVQYNQGTLGEIRPEKVRADIKALLSKPQFKDAINRPRYTSNGEVIVDRILRFEHLDSELPQLLRNVGLDPTELSLPNLKSNARHVSPNEILDAETKDRIYDLFQPTFELMGYER